MSVLNLGLQSVGLARELVPREEVEQEVSHCNNMSQVRELASKKPFIREALIDSMAPVKITLTDITQRERSLWYVLQSFRMILQKNGVSLMKLTQHLLYLRMKRSPIKS